jgi:hypothetical protein
VSLEAVAFSPRPATEEEKKIQSILGQHDLIDNDQLEVVWSPVDWLES